MSGGCAGLIAVIRERVAMRAALTASRLRGSRGCAPIARGSWCPICRF
ncbi:hypothetical protein BZL30_4414 [Mycobacterium kansasii]|uniref:Uncharacterized protein n=1 Tax=Mycobacterium kansasii TaxID=1768 RepID=A0A1V3X366_MYCKA|nr:hypothetical protein BZL30_4414 [Mycobacterium kansasii]